METSHFLAQCRYDLNNIFFRCASKRHQSSFLCCKSMVFKRPTGLLVTMGTVQVRATGEAVHLDINMYLACYMSAR